MSTISEKTTSLLLKFIPGTTREEFDILAVAVKLLKDRLANEIGKVSGTTELVLSKISDKNKTELRTIIISSVAVGVSNTLRALIDMLAMENVAAATVLRSHIINSLQEKS